MSRSRIVIANVRPQVDCGRWAAKACVGDVVPVSATVLRDGHEILRAAVLARPGEDREWRRLPLEPVGNDRYEGGVPVDALGRWQLAVEAWVDRHATWLDEYDRKVGAGQRDLSGELSEGEALFGAGSVDEWRRVAPALGERSRADLARSEPVLVVEVERERARFGAWYELFPRSWGGFAGVAAAIPELARLGFDVVYLPPVHPIGRTNRKGRNNAERAAPGDPGSPWAIGAAEGGHEAVHPELGTLDDFAALVAAAREHGIEIALDLAIQFSPDHPWLREHPEWFQHRPDGTLKYAENPPKRYQDIHSPDWGAAESPALWQALRSLVALWCERGIRIFRVDNPHTKPVPFWEWLIDDLRRTYPDLVLLSEAFTRPAMMTTLAKAGFSQSYTYFTWKNTKAELVDLVEQIRSWSDFYRPNFFVNTPDILHAYLQQGGRPAFEARLVLAATLSPSYGVYSGFEALERVPVRDGSEEYLDSEKYEVKERRLDGELLPLVARLNAIRREHAALRRFENLAWLRSRPDTLVAYAKSEPGDTLLVVVNVDPMEPVEGAVTIGPGAGLPDAFRATDLLTDEAATWRLGDNRVRLPPGGALIMHVHD